MKQRITVEQLNELTDEHKERLIEFYQSVGDYTRTPLLTIGEMIELIEKTHHIKFFTSLQYEVHITRMSQPYPVKTDTFLESELCDAFWEAVKEVLK